MIFRSPRERRRLSVVARALAQHAVVSVMALVVVGATAAIVCVRVVQSQALRQAESSGRTIATNIVAPLVTPELYDLDPDAQKALDDKIAELQRARDALRRLARECGAGGVGPCPILTSFEDS